MVYKKEKWMNNITWNGYTKPFTSIPSSTWSSYEEFSSSSFPKNTKGPGLSVKLASAHTSMVNGPPNW